MKVFKFGGTSLADATRINRALALAREQSAAGLVLVASAVAGTTDTLSDLADAAGQAAAAPTDALLAEVASVHRSLATDLLGAGSPHLAECRPAIDSLLQELSQIVAGLRLLRFSMPRARASILGFGERLATVIIAARSTQLGLATRLLDARRLVRTDDNFLRAAVDRDETTRLIRAAAAPAADELVVVQGFLGSTVDGATTTLGRGGSDYSATLFGAALAATEVVIWTDVDGVMTCDPRVVPAALPVERLSYREAAELAYFGARVLHPETIRPAVESQTRVAVRSPAVGAGPGTAIHIEGEASGPRAIAFKRNIVAVNVTSSRMLNAYGFLRRIFAIFEEHRTPVDLVTTSEVSVSITIDDAGALGAIVADLAHVGSVGLHRNQTIISIVGDGLRDTDDVLVAAAAALDGTPVTLLALGASDINLSFVVPDRVADDTVRALHDRLFGSGGRRLAKDQEAS